MDGALSLAGGEGTLLWGGGVLSYTPPCSLCLLACMTCSFYSSASASRASLHNYQSRFYQCWPTGPTQPNPAPLDRIVS